MTNDEAWTPIGELPDYNRYWTEFEERFTFRPSVSPEVRPGIREPAHSVTLSLTPIFEEDARLSVPARRQSPQRR